MSPEDQPKLYRDLAPWFHLLTTPEDYAGEAQFIRETILNASRIPVRSVLELGSGGGNNASHLKAHFAMTLVDLSPAMLDLSRTLNPECEHIQGDMRKVRLQRDFDAVFVHDAVMYMTTRTALLECMQTGYVHCKSGGAVLFMPDLVKETFVSSTYHGGHGSSARSLRYLEWIADPDPHDTTYTVDFAILLREGGKPVRVEHDSHVFGLFSREEWIGWLHETGFAAAAVVRDPWDREVFVGVRP